MSPARPCLPAVLLGVLSLTACGPAADEPAPAGGRAQTRDATGAGPDDAGRDGAGTAAPATDAGWPRRLDLPGGGVLELAAPPVRVVPAASGSVDLLCALLPPERIAALPAQALQYSNLDDEAAWASRPRFERYVAEPLLALRPDLVVAYALQSPATTEVLASAGVPVLELPDPLGLDELRGQIALLGRATGREARAAELLASLDVRLDVLAAERETRAGLSALTYTNGGSGGWTAGAGTTQDEVLRLAGLSNAAARRGREGHGRIDYEELLTLDPDVIVVAGFDDGRSVTAGLLEVEPALADLAAVRAGAVVFLPDRLFSATSHALVTAAESVASQVDTLRAAGALP